LRWFEQIPASWGIVSGFVMLAWFVVILICRRINCLREPYARTGVFFPPTFGWISLGELPYRGVVWRIRVDAPGSSGASDPNEIDLSTIEAEVPPKCPECQTEIEESRSFWGGYLWRCVNCRFKKRNRDSYFRTQARVEKIARRRFEESHLEE